MKIPRFHLRPWKKSLLLAKGQSSIEYMFMLVVVVTISLAIGKKVRAFMVGTGECPNESLICRVMEGLQAPGFLNGTYRYFTLKR